MALRGFLIAVLNDNEDCHELVECNDDVFVLAVGSTVMQRGLSRIQGYFEETVPSYFGDDSCISFRVRNLAWEFLGVNF